MSRKKAVALASLVFAYLFLCIWLYNYAVAAIDLCNPSTATTLGAAVVALGLYPFVWRPFLRLNTNGIDARLTAFVVRTYLWNEIAEFRIVRHTPIIVGLPYPRSYLGIALREHLDRVDEAVGSIYRKVATVDYLFPDCTTWFDGSIYGREPTELAAFLNQLLGEHSGDTDAANRSM